MILALLEGYYPSNRVCQTKPYARIISNLTSPNRPWASVAFASATAHPNTPGPKYTLGNGIISIRVPKWTHVITTERSWP